MFILIGDVMKFLLGHENNAFFLSPTVLVGETGMQSRESELYCTRVEFLSFQWGMLCIYKSTTPSLHFLS